MPRIMMASMVRTSAQPCSDGARRRVADLAFAARRATNAPAATARAAPASARLMGEHGASEIAIRVAINVSSTGTPWPEHCAQQADNGGKDQCARERHDSKPRQVPLR